MILEKIQEAVGVIQEEECSTGKLLARIGSPEVTVLYEDRYFQVKKFSHEGKTYLIQKRVDLTKIYSHLKVLNIEDIPGMVRKVTPEDLETWRSMRYVGPATSLEMCQRQSCPTVKNREKLGIFWLNRNVEVDVSIYYLISGGTVLLYDADYAVTSNHMDRHPTLMAKEFMAAADMPLKWFDWDLCRRLSWTDLEPCSEDYPDGDVCPTMED